MYVNGHSFWSVNSTQLSKLLSYTTKTSILLSSLIMNDKHGFHSSSSHYNKQANEESTMHSSINWHGTDSTTWCAQTLLPII